MRAKLADSTVTLRDQLIHKRNKRMGARVIELLLNNPGQSFFFAFGAGHFVGDHTIIEVGVQEQDDVSHLHIPR